MKKFLLLLLSLVATAAIAQNINVSNVRLAGPYRVLKPILLDSVDAAQSKYSRDALLNSHLSSESLRKAGVIALSQAPKSQDTNSADIYLAGFSFTSKNYENVEVKVSGPKRFKVYVDEKEASGSMPYTTGLHQVMIKYVADTAQIKVELSVKDTNNLVVNTMSDSTKRPFNMEDNMLMRHYSGVSVSPSGKYAKVGKSWFNPDGTSHYETHIIEVATGRELANQNFTAWMPKSDKYLSIRNVDNRNDLYSVDPATNESKLLFTDLPTTNIDMAPTEDYLILTEMVEGPKRESEVYEILNPEDRQPGWRNRYNISKLELATGIVQPLTYGNKSVWVSDFSADGRYLLLSFSNDRFTKRPTTLTTACRLDLQTMQLDTLIAADGFINGSGTFIPGTNNKILIIGAPEAFDRVGCTLPDSLIPNQFDYQMYLFDADTRKATPLTRDFNPSIKTLMVANNGTIYFTAENADSVSLYRMDSKTYAISQVDQPCEVISGCSLSANGSTMLYYGTGACEPDRLYSLSTKRNTVKLIEDLNAERMSQIALGTCHAFRFMSKNGYPLTGHYYLPANFDSTAKYPVIVHYYGGCSPTARRFGNGSHYPAHYWSANGYIVLIVNPGGASGFGQEWGARHVNTMGEGIAEDIIEATEWFAQNPWVNKDKIGCVSASYGGFMTQLLLTKTDLFATGISHAGISDHTSYWGEGYWGYSYSEVSAADSYPWTRKDLYVDRSPLYNADKIHKPLLFTHGTADTNVPIGESIQMYTALKLLGVPTAFVMVEGENHGIMAFSKREKWINTMVAWFDRWLKDDPTWWNTIYTPKDL